MYFCEYVHVVYKYNDYFIALHEALSNVYETKLDAKILIIHVFKPK